LRYPEKAHEIAKGAPYIHGIAFQGTPEVTITPPGSAPFAEQNAIDPVALARRPLWNALLRGLGAYCPSCGKSRLFNGYLTLKIHCPACGLDLQRYRADDAPAYFTIVIVGHIVVPLLLLVERLYSPSTLFELSLWLPLSLVLTLAILPRAKGALVAVNWATEAGG
jgi:uncharacterized protein (DUF983 family)